MQLRSLRSSHLCVIFLICAMLAVVSCSQTVEDEDERATLEIKTETSAPGPGAGGGTGAVPAVTDAQPPAPSQPQGETQSQGAQSNNAIAEQTAIFQVLNTQQNPSAPTPAWRSSAVDYASNWLTYFNAQVAYQKQNAEDGAEFLKDQNPFVTQTGEMPWVVDFMLNHEDQLTYYHGMYSETVRAMNTTTRMWENVARVIGYYVKFSVPVVDSLGGDGSVSTSGKLFYLDVFSFIYHEAWDTHVPLSKGTILINMDKSGDPYENATVTQHIQSPKLNIQIAAGKRTPGSITPPPVGEGPYNELLMRVDGYEFGSTQKGMMFLRRPVESSGLR